MEGETDVRAMLARLTVIRRPRTYVVARVEGSRALGAGIEAVIGETEGTTVVATQEVADTNGWEGFNAAWLTLEVHSSLEAVGLTAAVAAALAEQTIPCNVLSGFFHDHLLVPVARADDAITAIDELRASITSTDPR